MVKALLDPGPIRISRMEITRCMFGLKIPLVIMVKLKRTNGKLVSLDVIILCVFVIALAYSGKMAGQSRCPQ